MGAAKAIRKILIDEDMTIKALAEKMNKPRQTIANTFSKDHMSVANTLDYANALGYELILRDKKTGREYQIYE